MDHWFNRLRLVGCGLVLFVCGCEVSVASDLTEGDANQVVVALAAQNISAVKARDPQSEGLFKVDVARDDVASAIGALHSAGLPSESRPGVLQALGEGGLVASSKSEQARLVAGIAGDLETSLRAIDGVLGARVHLAVPPEDPFSDGESEKPASASVLLRHRGNTTPIGERDIQRLIAGALTGLVPESVAVVTYPSPSAALPTVQALTKIGPFAVTKASASWLRVVLGGAVLLNIVWLALLLFLWTRLRRTRVGEFPEGTT